MVKYISQSFYKSIKKHVLILLFSTLNSLVINAQEKINAGKYLYEQEKFFDIITIQSDSTFEYLEYYKPLEKLIDKKDKIEIQNVIKSSKAKKVITGSGKYKIENKTLILKFYNFDTHKNQINFEFNTNSLRFVIKELEKL